MSWTLRLQDVAIVASAYPASVVLLRRQERRGRLLDPAERLPLPAALRIVWRAPGGPWRLVWRPGLAPYDWSADAAR